MEICVFVYFIDRAGGRAAVVMDGQECAAEISGICHGTGRTGVLAAQAAEPPW